MWSSPAHTKLVKTCFCGIKTASFKSPNEGKQSETDQCQWQQLNLVAGCRATGALAMPDCHSLEAKNARICCIMEAVLKKNGQIELGRGVSEASTKTPCYASSPTHGTSGTRKEDTHSEKTCNHDPTYPAHAATHPDTVYFASPPAKKMPPCSEEETDSLQNWPACTVFVGADRTTRRA
jgi:hypothetical protein